MRFQNQDVWKSGLYPRSWYLAISRDTSDTTKSVLHGVSGFMCSPALCSLPLWSDVAKKLENRPEKKDLVNKNIVKVSRCAHFADAMGLTGTSTSCLAPCFHLSRPEMLLPHFRLPKTSSRRRRLKTPSGARLSRGLTARTSSVSTFSRKARPHRHCRWAQNLSMNHAMSPACCSCSCCVKKTLHPC